MQQEQTEASGAPTAPIRNSLVSTSTSSRKPLKKPTTRERVVSGCCWIVEHRFVVALTTFLTVWVLIGEDLKLLTTQKPADIYFGVIGLFCLFVFTLEIILASIGKPDYFLGFFFILDVISTSSLVLDLPWVTAAMNNEDDESSMMANAKGGRTARIGARSARVVRVIRLIRIAKLYKAVVETKKQNANGQMKKSMETDDEEEVGGNESRVGKKLSDLTIRRVIILVLTMLIILPLLTAEEASRLPTSADFGADQVWLTYSAMNGSAATRETYENALLRYIYYHNWYAGREPCPTDTACPNIYLTHLFWVGVSGSESNNMDLRAYADKAKLSNESVVKFSVEQQTKNHIYNYGTIPSVAQNNLKTEWLSCPAEGSGAERIGLSMIRYTIEGIVDYAAPCYTELRAVERARYQPSAMSVQQYDKLHFDFWFDERPFVKEEAAFSIATTFFVCVVLTAAAMLFNNDVNQLVLYPVEHMITKVEAIRDDPLNAVNMAEKAYAKEVVATRDEGMTTLQAARAELCGRLNECSQKCGQLFRLVSCSNEKKKNEPMEMMILEKTIIKLGSLLALGFGEAGSQIIAQNMAGSSFGVNVMTAGNRVDAAIGHARIQSFSVATEVLQSRVMTFVNQVAEIVHGVVEANHGAANKNNGDTFLLIWRCDKKLENGLSVDTNRIADLSVLAFAKLIAAIHRSTVLAEYRGHPGLQNVLGSNYRVKLTLGLHMGWAIEGAVGSEYKIEASYLSPNVAIAVSVEGATSIYQVHFLTTGALVNQCSTGIQNKCRLIDNVIVPGSRHPLELYCIDLDIMKVDLELPFHIPTFGAKQRMVARQFLEVERNKMVVADIRVAFEQDQTLTAMRAHVTTEFWQLFRMGYRNYVEGEWQVARRFLEESMTMTITETRQPDGPSAALIHYMQGFYFEAPESWTGARVIDLAAMLTKDHGDEHSKGLPNGMKVSM